MSLRLALVALVLCSFPASALERFTGKVVAVADGDTISVMRDGRSVRVRLEGIDCPEKGQDFSQRAKQFTSDLTFGKEVSVDVRDVDRYGRLVARVCVGGKDVSVALVEAGLAWHFTKYSRDPELAKAERAGRQAKRGLWTLANPIAPWDFRREKRSPPKHRAMPDSMQGIRSLRSQRRRHSTPGQISPAEFERRTALRGVVNPFTESDQTQPSHVVLPLRRFSL